MVGLPSAALAVMLGVVFAVNTHRYGWVGVLGGVALIAGGVLLGLRCFGVAPPVRDSESPVSSDPPTS